MQSQHRDEGERTNSEQYEVHLQWDYLLGSIICVSATVAAAVYDIQHSLTLTHPPICLAHLMELFNPDRGLGPCILHSLYEINALDRAGVCQNSIPI